MKKVLIIFRGLNYRSRRVVYPPPPLSTFNPSTFNKTIWVDGLEAIDNWNETLFKNLKDNDIDYDIAFVTYPSPILEKLVNKLSPKYLFKADISEHWLYNYGKDQNSNFRAAVNLAGENLDNYDRFILLRFDLQYRINITKWPKWNEKGITLLGKDAHWPRKPSDPGDLHHLYFDHLFIFDTDYYKYFKEAVDDMKRFPHDIGRYLYENNIPLNIMYDDYYTLTNHPLVSYLKWEENPDLNNPFPGIKMPPMLHKPTFDDVDNWIKEYGEEIIKVVKVLYPHLIK